MRKGQTQCILRCSCFLSAAKNHQKIDQIAVWTDKKLAPNWSLQASKTLPSRHRNTMPLKDGPMPATPNPPKRWLRRLLFHVLLALASFLLPLASYSFLCFLSSCSISFPLFSDALPLLSAGSADMYVYIKCWLAITPGQAHSCRVETDMVVESLGKWQSLAQHLICRYSVCWLQWAKAWFIHCFFNQSRTGERSACWSSQQVKKLKRSIRFLFWPRWL